VPTAYVGLGSNLDTPETQLRSALAELDALPQSRCLAHSSLYRSPPMQGPDVPAGQADFLNAVAALDTELNPTELLKALQGLENRHHRQRAQRWGPRSLDLDLLLYGEQTINLPELSVPHPGLYERNFVLYPLAELLAERAENFQIPGRGSLISLLAACARGELEKLTSAAPGCG
jgi:2-amino-4-hydroxy-6-hydroxymethyldihydropteridine diphosphokinase